MSKQKRKTVDRSKVSYPRPDRREPVDTLKEGLTEHNESVAERNITGSLVRKNPQILALMIMGMSQ
jgi:hypothetical protein